MRYTERDYEAFAEDRFPDMAPVRSWPDCTLWSAGVEEYLQVLVDERSRQAAVFEYDDWAERERDIHLVRCLPNDDNGAGALIPAFLKPKPPDRSGRNAAQKPVDEN